ncbi:MAG: DNA/RNA nuclease SfsA [Clostridia bacterium]|nr:DNA/RNA nuclease SfsA [Clostridia bacterium]
MIYQNIKPGKFVSRPNRFIANIIIDGKEQVCHVKNTGRCRELLVPGAQVFVQEWDKPDRKTKYDLISVYKGDMLVNMDSQAPNRVFGEWATESGFFGKPRLIKPECRYKNSRFDYYIETENRKIFVEVKGVTLENNGVLSFPDAPTERGVKHVNELCRCIDDGYEAYVFFIVQMEHCLYFEPNREHHPEFADALKAAAEHGVQVKCLNCRVTPVSLEAKDFAEVRLTLTNYKNQI